MTRQSMFQAKKESQPLQTSSLFRRQAAQAPAAEQEPAFPPIHLGQDHSAIPFKPVHPAPALGPSSTSCPFTPQRCPFGGACHACPPKMQAKLKIGQPGDRYEQETDRVAEQVMRMPEPQVQRKCSAPGCKDEDDEKKLLQTKPASAGEAGAQVDHPLIQSVLSSPGQPLDAGTRSFMEPRFGQDFSGVRVHVGGQAAESARAVSARAYTVGRDVVFGEGQYAPGSDEGRRLVAHELVHVGQQTLSTIHTSLIESHLSIKYPKFLTASQHILQKKDCNFYVYDSTEPTTIGKAWKYGAHALALATPGGYAVGSSLTIEYMLNRILKRFSEGGCDCIEEIQFWSHGSSGSDIFISETGDEITADDFNIPNLSLYERDPSWIEILQNTSYYKSWKKWFDGLSWRQQLLLQIRYRICGSDAEIYYRSCNAFQGKKGQEFAKKSSEFWGSNVVGHTKIIGITQPGKKTLRQGQEPYWSESEGETTEMKKKGKKSKKY